MKVIISPAKSLDFTQSPPLGISLSKPDFLMDALVINKVLRKMSMSDLSKLMDLSKNLTALNWERNQTFCLDPRLEDTAPAIYAFDGDVYQGFDITTFPKDKIPQMQENIRILSGLYGILKPLDVIQAHRLEMSTKLLVKRRRSLYHYWSVKVTKSLKRDLKPKEILLNLASQEYATVINFDQIKNSVISPVFKDFKEGNLKIISFYAKKARGMMARYVAEEDIETLNELKEFNFEGYNYSDEYTKNPNEPVFIR